jgi:competence protein ComEC
MATTKKTTRKKSSSNGLEKATKKACKKIYKKNKNNPVFWVVLLVFILIIAFGVIYVTKINPSVLDKLLNRKNPDATTVVEPTNDTTPNETSKVVESTDDTTPIDTSKDVVEGINYPDFQIHFMTLGNDKAGDSVYIKAGENDILIDAGSRSNSSTTTLSYMNNYVNDKKLEYVIATHGDQDHIEAFPNILSQYSAGIIIYNQNTSKTTQAYKNTIAAFNNQVTKNSAKIYYAGDCFNNQNGAKRTYKLSDKVTMDIMYNYYYWNKSSDENNYSVCTMFTYASSTGNKYFMLTGDLEKEGEEKLAEYYDSSSLEKTLPHVDLFKAGHHGSKTSSNDVLLNKIQPKMCVVSCCCGTDEYTGATINQFPTQAFINRIAKWTDMVYVTSIYDSFSIEKAGSKTDKNGKLVSDKTGVEIGKEYIHSTGRKDMNGNIVVSCGETGGVTKIGLTASNNLIKLKDSDWMATKVTIDGVEQFVREMPEEWK